MNKTSRFNSYGLENSTDETINDAPLTEEEVLDAVEEKNEAENELAETIEDGEMMASAKEGLESLIVAIENILAEGRATKEVSILVDMQARSIVEPFGFNYEKFSLENFEDDHTQHLQATCEGIFNWLERYNQALILNQARVGQALERVFRSNEKIIKGQLTNLYRLEAIVKSTKNDHDAKLDFSFSGAGKYFKVVSNSDLPNFEKDFSVTKYIVNDYNKITTDAINAFVKAVDSGDLTTEDGVAAVAKKVGSIKNPAESFKKEFLNDRSIFFGQNKLVQDNPSSPITIKNDESLLEKLLAHPTGEMAGAADMTIGDYHDLIKETINYAKMLLDGCSKVSKQNNYILALDGAIKKVSGTGAGGREIAHVGKVLKSNYLSPLTQEISRGTKTVQKLNAVLNATLYNSPWKLRSNV